MVYMLLLSGTMVLFLGALKTGSGHTIPADELDSFRLVNDFVDENEDCFRCHGEAKYQIKGEENGRILTRHMYEGYVIPRKEYYSANHKSFSCFDCHSIEYAEFPHPLDSRMEEPWNCVDCHGFDNNYAHYHFLEIEEEYMQSVHHLANPEEFNCWECHPHEYHISNRNTENLSATIAYDNAICLDCHADFNQFKLLTDREGINIIQTHDWLPNQALHFQNVRCIDCHTKINDSILVAHLILPKEQAVRRCEECHSRDSRLMVTLYKFQAKEARSKYGFVNAAIINDAFVIGANRNYFLNLLSGIIFALTFLGLVLHIGLRIIKKV